MRTIHFALRRAVFAAVLALQGCAVAPSFHDTRMPGAPVTFSRLYIYSFLDIADAALGPSLRRELSQQLAAGLESRGVSSEQHSFANTPVAGEFARVRNQEEHVESIPVGRVILQNAANERRFGAEYRLIAFPTQTRVVGSGRTYDIRWEIQDVRGARTVWTTTSRSRHTNWISTDENAAERARVIVDGLLSEMTSSGLLR